MVMSVVLGTERAWWSCWCSEKKNGVRRENKRSRGGRRDGGEPRPFGFTGPRRMTPDDNGGLVS